MAIIDPIAQHRLGGGEQLAVGIAEGIATFVYGIRTPTIERRSAVADSE